MKLNKTKIKKMLGIAGITVGTVYKQTVKKIKSERMKTSPIFVGGGTQ